MCILRIVTFEMLREASAKVHSMLAVSCKAQHETFWAMCVVTVFLIRLGCHCSFSCLEPPLGSRNVQDPVLVLPSVALRSSPKCSPQKAVISWEFCQADAVQKKGPKGKKAGEFRVK